MPKNIVSTLHRVTLLIQNNPLRLVLLLDPFNRGGYQGLMRLTTFFWVMQLVSRGVVTESSDSKLVLLMLYHFALPYRVFGRNRLGNEYEHAFCIVRHILR